MQQEQIAPLKRPNSEVSTFTYCESRFQFLVQFGGLPLGCLTTVLGVSGGGKSTLARTIAVDASYSNKVFIWSSEESVSNYSTGLTGAKIENIVIMSEHDIERKTVLKLNSVENCIEYFKTAVIRSRAKVVIFENITTSILYDDKHVSIQSQIARELNRLAIDLEVAIVLLVHTKKGSGKNFITLDDVRGSAQSAQVAPLFIILHSFKIMERFCNFVTIEKHRYWELKNKTFELKYMSKIYTADILSNTKQLKSAFKGRD